MVSFRGPARTGWPLPRSTPAYPKLRISEDWQNGLVQEVDVQIPPIDKNEIYRAKKRKLPSCCSEFSNKFSTEQADGQVFCLHGVCPLIKSHLFLVPGGPEKHLVKGIMSDWRDKNRMNIPLGENGELVNICPSPQGNSYIIKFDLKVLLALPTISFDAMRPTGYIAGIESPLCLRARHNFTDHSVEYLDIGAKDEESIEEEK